MLTPIKPLQLELTPGQKKLLAVCREHHSIPRAKIVELTGLRSGSVTSISKELLAMNMINEGSREKVGRGQPIIPLQLNPYAAFSFGIAFHIHRIEVALANFCGEVIDTEVIDYAEDSPILDVLACIKIQVDSLVDKHKIQNARILGIGVSMPGPSEGDGTSIRTIIQMKHWRHTDLAEMFGATFEWPVWIDNDCNVAAVGEFYSGRWPDVKNMVLFELGHGVGGGRDHQSKVIPRQSP
ncbi:ROK family protein [Vibrio sp. 10N.286.48.B7]|uniref:ROK family protein n=1 Tax=Vibrio sp. 10N.286.48.B7 TaxID=1880853 RepID=UPI0039A69A5B